MRRPTWIVLIAAWLVTLCGRPAAGQTTPTPVQAAPRDVSLEAAEALLRRALFLRGFYLADDLAYDALGRVQGAPKTGDWTLAGMDVRMAERHGPKEIFLEGVRVAVRYNQDNHQFERHPQKTRR